jgi:hypothetical protein
LQLRSFVERVGGKAVTRHLATAPADYALRALLVALAGNFAMSLREQRDEAIQITKRLWIASLPLAMRPAIVAGG